MLAVRTKFVSSRRRLHIPTSMLALEVHRYGPNLAGVGLNDSRRVPTITRPDEMLVQVHASSVNPIDLRFSEGYGRTTMNFVRRLQGQASDELPRVLGRDCTGVVQSIGTKVTKFKPGDKIWAAPEPSRQGCHSEFAIIRENEAARKPSNLSSTDAASLPYVALTTWQALIGGAGLDSVRMPGKRVFVMGGSGGIGSFAIQIIKAWGGHVTTTCSSSAVTFVRDLGADVVIDYTLDDSTEALVSLPSFDVVFHTIGDDSEARHLKVKSGGTFVSISNPFLSTVDQRGLVQGLACAMKAWGRKAFQERVQNGVDYRWEFFKPNFKALEIVASLVEKEKIKPIVQSVHRLSEGLTAYKELADGHTRGKIVIEMKRS